MRRRGAAGSFLALALTGLASLLPAQARAQSLLATGGLGVPVDALDARARALGGIGVGLLGGGLSAVDPTAVLGLPVPTVTFSSLSSWVNVQESAGTGSYSATRFPLGGVSYPVSGVGTFSLTFGSVLDQRWTVQEPRSVVLEGTTVPATDSFLSEGGLVAVKLGFARRIAPSLGLGVTVGPLTGDVRRTFTRAFDTLATNVPVTSFTEGGRWDYSGVTASAGAVVDVSRLVRGSVAVTWNSRLDAKPAGSTTGDGRSYDLPLEVRAGVSGVLAPGLSADAGVYWADWKPTVTQDRASRALTLGGGVEWGRAHILGKDAALRLGYHRADLPFAYRGGDARESAWTGGVGLVMAGGANLPLAQIDLSVARGRRTSASLIEDFWRAGFSLRVSGF